MIDCNRYETDVYLYIDDEHQTGELYNFENVGGRSWLDDDHIIIYTDRGTNEDFYDVFNDISEVADSVGMTEDEIKIMALQSAKSQTDWYEDSTVDDMTMQNVTDMIDIEPDLWRKCAAWREEYIREICCDDVDDRVEEIIRKYDKWTAECRMEQRRGY